MPFLDGVYYPFVPKGTPAGAPSLINAPLSHFPAPSMTPSCGKSTIIPFRFRPKLERVDWRRINAVDISQVVNNLDVDALQELISSVTFCCLDGELCQRCRSPVDPALVKLLQLAQLTVEWLLHCQEFLTLSLRAAEEQLEKSSKDREELLVSHGRESNLLVSQMKKQEERMKEMTAELKQRKKIICNQQSMLASSSCLIVQKCHHCDKSFLNPSFLQSHLRRRHPGEYSKHKLTSHEETHIDDEQMENLKQEIHSLKEQIAQQQQALQAKAAQEKEQQSIQKELQNELDRFRAEEMARMDRKIEDSRDGIRREIELLCTRNIQAMNVLLQSVGLTVRRAVYSLSHHLFQDINQNQMVNHEETKLKKQERKWKSRLQELKVHHEAEKSHLLDELSRMQLSESKHKENIQQLKEEMVTKLQEKDEIIKFQLEQIKKLSNTKEVQVPELINITQKPLENKGRQVNRKKLRQEQEEIVLKRLENLGVKHPCRGIKHSELRSILARHQPTWEGFANWVGGEDSNAAPEPQSRAWGLVQGQPLSCTVPAQVSTPPLPKTVPPSPSLQTGPPPKTPPSNTKVRMRVYTNRIPPFSSDDESEDKYLNMDVHYPKPEKEKEPDTGLYHGSPAKLPTCPNNVIKMGSPPCSLSSIQPHLSATGTGEESEDDKYDDEDTDEDGEEEERMDDDYAEDSSDVSKDTDSVQLTYVEDLNQCRLGKDADIHDQQAKLDAAERKLASCFRGDD
ncbi:cilium assembly protein DZIP1-like isoform X1 [Synchiropus splendidus]|uniref:cilium assembly protein DZIP1-like isoform X1 n=1 Tax=Synchiropus splendidus TaxID=270530 RepID=UPI00237E2180|nr:cilium assembly protein DZIP1-like isoform X1 [Synchiropus splendidus]